MSFSRFIQILVVVAVILVMGTALVGWGASISSGPVRPEFRVGNQQPGTLSNRKPVRWTPKEDSNGNSVTINLPPDDLRVLRFADFAVETPLYIPSRSRLKKVVLFWDPSKDERIVQFVLEGSPSALITEKRLRKRTGEFPEGIRITSVPQPDGSIIRNLQSNVEGVGISIAANSSTPDEEILRIFRALHSI